MEEKDISVGDIYTYSAISNSDFFTHGKFYSITQIISHNNIGGSPDIMAGLTCDKEGFEYTLPVKLLNDTGIFTKVGKTNPVNLIKLLFDTIFDTIKE